MTRQTDLYADYVDRTRQLLQQASVTNTTIALYTGLPRSWVDRFATCADREAKRENASRIARLHDWLIVLLLTDDASKFGPVAALLHLGEAALYMYIQHQQLQSGGLIIKNQRASILNAAREHLVALRRQIY